MKLRMDRQIPKESVIQEGFEYDFAKARRSIGLEQCSMHEATTTIVEEKYDGSRFGAVITDDNVQIISRNNIDRAKNVPYITKILKEIFPPNTILDGEMVHIKAPRSKRWEMARSVMGTKEFNPDIEPIQYLIFDIQFLNGENLRNKKLTERKKMLALYIARVQEKLIQGETTLITQTLCMPRQFPLHMAEQLFLKVVADKGEGIMLKSLNEQYARSWTKVKKVFTLDCFVTGIEKGKGKYEGQVGSLKLGVFKAGVIVDIGKASGMSDSERHMFTDMAFDGDLLHSVIEVKANEVTKNFKLRHPNFVRTRDDKPYKECSFEQLEDLVK